MGHNIYKKAISLFTLLFLMIVCTGNVYAADSVNIAVSSLESTVGGEVSVTFTLSGNTGNIEMVDLWVSYDAAILTPISGFDQGGGGKIRILSTSGSSSYTVKFNAVAAGESSVGIISDQSIVSTPNADQNRAAITAGAGKVTVKGTVKQSAVNNLTSLNVSPGTLTPAFNKDTTTYSITLTESCSKLTISAVPEDSKAKVAVTGAVMDPGNNVTKVTVTAENGDTKVYTIYTKVPEPPTQKVEEKLDLTVEVNGTKCKVINKFDEKLLPEGYEQNDYLYQKKTVTIGKGLSNGQIIFCVTNADDEKGEPFFVLYNEQNGNFSPLNLITSKGATYTVMDVVAMDGVDIPEGFVEGMYKINNVDYIVYTEEKNENPQSFLVYCSNLKGEAGWYQYDTVEGTMQRAFLVSYIVEPETTVPVVEETTEMTVDNDLLLENQKLQSQYDDYVKKSKLALTLMAVLLATIVLVVVIFIMKSFSDAHDDFDEYEEPEEYEKFKKSASTKEDDVKNEKNIAESKVKKEEKKDLDDAFEDEFEDEDDFEDDFDDYDDEDDYDEEDEEDESYIEIVKRK